MFDLLFSPGWLIVRFKQRGELGSTAFVPTAALCMFSGIKIRDVPFHLCRSRRPSLVHKDTHTYTHTHSHSVSEQTVQTHPAPSPALVCLYVHACVLTAARQTVNKQYCLMPVCDSVCLLWAGARVCVCVRICVLA